jgi:hypothetical protein
MGGLEIVFVSFRPQVNMNCFFLNLVHGLDGWWLVGHSMAKKGDGT